jgi:hypothetical protein
VTRKPDWAAQLYRVIDEHADRPFAWGVNDCCLFVARAWDAMTGSQLEQQLGEIYGDERSGLRFIVAHGDLQGAVSEFLGPPQDVRATRGAAVLFEGGEGDAVGICRGLDIVSMGPRGLQVNPRGDAQIRAVWPPP